MSLQRLKSAFAELVSCIDRLENQDSRDINDDLENITTQLDQVVAKIKSIDDRGISDSDSGNQDALLSCINHYRRENAYYELLDFHEAVRELKRVIDESTDSHVIASAYNGLGHIYAVRKCYEEALVNFKMVVEFYPDYVDGHYNLGATYYNLNMFDEAIREFNKAIRLDHDDRESILALSRAYRKRGNQEMSKYYYEQFSRFIS